MSPTQQMDIEITSFRNQLNSQLRREKRYRCPLATIAYARPQNGEVEERIVWLANVSKNGLAFIAETPFQAGDALILRARSLGAETLLQLRVVHATQQPNGDWIMGCLLDRPLTDDEIDRLLQIDPEE
jgi:hypothetical protein